MKKVISLAVMAMLAVSASAQLASDMSATDIDAPGSYNLVGVSYDNLRLSGKNYDFGNDKSWGLNGFGVEYTHGFSLSSSLPMYLEAGFKFNIGYGSKSIDEDYDDYSYKIKMQMMRLNVPVSYAWRFNVGDGMAVTPYAGLDFRFNVLGRIKANDDEWMSVFNEDDMGEDETWNRFQLGWHIGVGFNYKHLYVGVNYGTDFINAFKYKKSSVSSGNLGITLGYTF